MTSRFLVVCFNLYICGSDSGVCCTALLEIVDAALTLHIGESSGNALAISSGMALTALHGHHHVGDKAVLVDCHGTRFSGIVKFCIFEEHLVDIAVIVLDHGASFLVYCEIERERVTNMQKLTVVGRTRTSHDNIMLHTITCEVTAIELDEGSCLFRTYFPSERGLSGSGVITARHGDTFRVVGVHIGTQDDTVPPPEIESASSISQPSRKKKKTADILASFSDSVSNNSSSLAGSIHGHTAWCLICEAARVEGLLEFVDAVLSQAL
jgi:hypothetical protein